MSVPPRIPPELVGTVFRGSVAVRDGVLTKAMLRGPAWRRVLPDVYADALFAAASDPFLLRCQAAGGYVSESALATYAAEHPHTNAAKAFLFVDKRAESPPESRLRVALALAGLPAPVPQLVVVAAVSGQRFRLDLGWQEALVGVEYDGIHHAGYAQLASDRARLNALVDSGWVVLHVTAPQLADPVAFQRLVDQLRRLLESRSHG